MPTPYKINGATFAFLVVGPGHPSSGRIRRIPYSENICSPLHEYRDGVMRISTMEERGGGGSRWLDDLYAEEGKPNGAKLYAEFMDAAAKGRTGGEFPVELLPAKVREWMAAKKEVRAPFDVFARAAELASGDESTSETSETSEPVEVASAVHVPPPTSRRGRVAPEIPVMIDLPESNA